jgi:hypothetical protein
MTSPLCKVGFSGQILDFTRKQEIALLICAVSTGVTLATSYFYSREASTASIAMEETESKSLCTSA